MAKIRRGILTVGSSDLGSVKNISWNDSREFDRSVTDGNMSGDPVEMKHGGSGSLTLLSGNIPSGYVDDMIISYSEVSVSGGEETVVQKTVTFTGVTANSGGSLDNDSGPGSREISFEYSTSTTV
jgi:hypothetical protein